MRYMQKHASNQSLVCKLSLNVVVNLRSGVIIIIFWCFSASLAREEKKTEIKGKGMIAGYVVLERGNQQLKNGDK